MSIPTRPRATYRLQFHKSFTLHDAVPLVPYLASLGVSHVYASPLLKARPGSTHCYDIVDHGTINPELGGEEALRALVSALRARNMGLIVDIVPNHMGVGGSDNRWWLDVLEWGRASAYAEFFDIDWESPDPALRGKILAPFLGASYGEVLANGELTLECDRDAGRMFVAYHEHHFPISPRTTGLLLHNAAPFGEIAHPFAAAAKAPSRAAGRKAAAEARARFSAAIARPEGEAALASLLSRFDARTPEGRRRLSELLERQNYRLAWWRAAADEINWRRFFDINTLAGIRVERPAVFEATHAYLMQLYAQGLIDGVRIDHIDGLADPRGYCRKLRRAMEAASEARPAEAPQGPPYIVVEKILAPRERLPGDWRTDGTTGYDFMDQVSGVLHDSQGEAGFTQLWMALTGRPGRFGEEEEAARAQILRDNLASELNAAAAALHRIARRDPFTRDYTLTAIRRGLTELLVHFPVYRIYAGQAGHSETDTQVMERALAGARRSTRAANRPLLDLLRRWLLDESPRQMPPGPRRAERLRAMVRFQQLSAPVAAKSVEDTAFYRFGRLLSRNEVGSNPEIFALSPEAFHGACAERRKNLPGAMLALATHDHKRGPDVRARLAALSEMGEAWERALGRWTRLNGMLRKDLPEGTAPSAADELMLYQTLVSAWPVGLALEDREGVAAFESRVAAWAEKSVREAKLRSEWAAPDEAYEAAMRGFLAGCLEDGRPVAAEIAAFAARLDVPGAVNGLSQVVLHLAAPGMPDLYQGSEFWDQSLVDPDNRRPVDFTARQEALARGAPPSALLPEWRNGAVKQAVIARALALRAERPDVFAEGEYVKLAAEGEAATHVVAFARPHGDATIIALATRLPVALLGDAELPLLSAEAWGDTAIVLPAGNWRDVLSDSTISGGAVPVSQLLARLPVGLLVNS